MPAVTPHDIVLSAVQSAGIDLVEAGHVCEEIIEAGLPGKKWTAAEAAMYVLRLLAPHIPIDEFRSDIADARLTKLVRQPGGVETAKAFEGDALDAILADRGWEETQTLKSALCGQIRDAAAQVEDRPQVCWIELCETYHGRTVAITTRCPVSQHLAAFIFGPAESFDTARLGRRTRFSGELIEDLADVLKGTWSPRETWSNARKLAEAGLIIQDLTGGHVPAGMTIH